MFGIGKRLQEERKRLKLSADKFGSALGVSGNTQYNYESDARPPDVNYLRGAHDLGVDIYYVITGLRLQGSLSADETLLLMDYRSLSPQEKFQASVAIRQLGLSSNNPPPAVHDAPASTPSDAAKAALEQAGVKVKGDAGNINTGPVDQSNMTMIVGGKAKITGRGKKK